MTTHDRLRLAAAALAVFSGAINAQVSDDVLARLAREGVVRDGASYFARATGLIRGTQEVEEHRLVTRAMLMLARVLCGFEPSSGTRLDADISGFTMVSSIQRGREIEVVVRAPLQTPTCRVSADAGSAGASSPASTPSTASTDRPAQRDAGAQAREPAHIRDENITIRVLGSEY